MSSSFLSCAFASFSCGSIIAFMLRRRIERIINTTKIPNVGPTKMVLVVRRDLNMTTGKIASQCSHAAVECIQASLAHQKDTSLAWLSSGQPKIILQCNSEINLINLQNKARQNKLISVIISDAGKTQLSADTKTVLGIGPGPLDLIDNVTSKLKLL